MEKYNFCTSKICKNKSFGDYLKKEIKWEWKIKYFHVKEMYK